MQPAALENEKARYLGRNGAITERLKALAKYLGEHKEELYAVSAHTGATRTDSWIDIEGGSGTLFAYAGVGSNELPSGNVVHEGPAMKLCSVWTMIQGSYFQVPFSIFTITRARWSSPR